MHLVHIYPQFVGQAFQQLGIFRGVTARLRTAFNCNFQYIWQAESRAGQFLSQEQISVTQGLSIIPKPEIHHGVPIERPNLMGNKAASQLQSVSSMLVVEGYILLHPSPDKTLVNLTKPCYNSLRRKSERMAGTPALHTVPLLTTGGHTTGRSCCSAAEPIPTPPLLYNINHYNTATYIYSSETIGRGKPVVRTWNPGLFASTVCAARTPQDKGTMFLGRETAPVSPQRVRRIRGTKK